MKNLFFISLLCGALVLLWEVPTWQKQAVSRQEIPINLKYTLPAIDTKTFLYHINTRLPHYQEQFHLAGRIYLADLAEKTKVNPWVLLAAQGYQESKWNRNALSPTGVRGIMMLTQVTARELGIHDRLDSGKSIEGGARYLAQLMRQIPKRIDEPDRLYMALAAYNVGMGHLRDARYLTRKLGKNPDRWDDVKTVLPLLAQKRYYTTLPHRYARGWEPVRYVERIQAYHEILASFILQKERQKSFL